MAIYNTSRLNYLWAAWFGLSIPVILLIDALPHYPSHLYLQPSSPLHPFHLLRQQYLLETNDPISQWSFSSSIPGSHDSWIGLFMYFEFFFSLPVVLYGFYRLALARGETVIGNGNGIGSGNGTGTESGNGTETESGTGTITTTENETGTGNETITTTENGTETITTTTTENGTETTTTTDYGTMTTTTTTTITGTGTLTTTFTITDENGTTTEKTITTTGAKNGTTPIPKNGTGNANAQHATKQRIRGTTGPQELLYLLYALETAFTTLICIHDVFYWDPAVYSPEIKRKMVVQYLGPWVLVPSIMAIDMARRILGRIKLADEVMEEREREEKERTQRRKVQ